jgi:hypothetical protein
VARHHARRGVKDHALNQHARESRRRHAVERSAVLPFVLDARQHLAIDHQNEQKVVH